MCFFFWVALVFVLFWILLLLLLCFFILFLFPFCFLFLFFFLFFFILCRFFFHFVFSFLFLFSSPFSSLLATSLLRFLMMNLPGSEQITSAHSAVACVHCKGLRQAWNKTFIVVLDAIERTNGAGADNSGWKNGALNVPSSFSLF